MSDVPFFIWMSYYECTAKDISKGGSWCVKLQSLKQENFERVRLNSVHNRNALSMLGKHAIPYDKITRGSLFGA